MLDGRGGSENVLGTEKLNFRLLANNNSSPPLKIQWDKMGRVREDYFQVDVVLLSGCHCGRRSAVKRFCMYQGHIQYL